MYGAAAWLVWVLSLQAGPDGVLAVVAGGVVLGLGAWAFGIAQQVDGAGRRAGQAVAVAAMVAAGVILNGIVPAPAAQASAEGTEPFSQARLAELRAQGRPVFVNMTAAWCVTCLVNEKVALSPARVRDAFAKHRVAYLKGDWTSGDQLITQFLHANARDGVPLYVLYPPGSGAPTVLPQILTEAEMLSQLDKFGS
jgi:thiol:disulfide interchange protein DsbD